MMRSALLAVLAGAVPWLLSLAAVSAGGTSTAPPAPPPARVALPLAHDAGGMLQAAERLIAAGQWERAFPILQAVADGPAGLVWDGRALVPVRTLVTHRIASLPPDGRRAYTALYEPEAARLLARGLAERSEGLLRDAAYRYANTESGIRALNALAALQMDAGDFEAALLTLSATPGRSGAGPTAARKLLCLARLGRRREAEDLVQAIRDAGTTHLAIGGETLALDALLAEAFALAPPGQGAPGDAPAPDPDVRTLVPVAVELPWPGGEDPARATMPSTRPVAAQGAIFVNRAGTVLAFESATGRPLWTAPPPGLVAELGRSVALGRPLDLTLMPLYLPVVNVQRWAAYDNLGMSTVCWADGRLYAVQMDPLAQKFPDQPWNATQDDLRLTNELRCYAATNGRLLWTTAAVDALSDRWFLTAPAVSGGRAYALTLRRGALWAVCLDARTGQRLWDAEIGALESRQTIQRYSMEHFLADAGPPAVAGGMVVFPTGQGVVCAFEAANGRLLWAAPYPRAQVRINRLGLDLTVPNGPWAPRAPLLSGDLCIAAPMDSRQVQALSLRTGEVLWRRSFPDGVAVLGMLAGKLYVQHAGVTCLDPASGEVLWATELPAAGTAVGALSREVVYLPAGDGLARVRTDDGRPLPTLPWPADSPLPGNLLALPDALVTCTPRRLIIYPAGGAAPRTAPPAAAGAPTDARREMRQALDGGAADRAAATYLDLCRRVGMDRPARRRPSGSLWTELADLVRSRCRERPGFGAAWTEHVQGLVRRAADAGDEAALEEVARWAPFPDSRAEALLRLAELQERTGRPDEARRTSLALLLDRPGARRAAAAALAGPPTAEAAWTLPGLLVLPDAPDSAGRPARALILGAATLKYVGARDGAELWSAPVPEIGAAERPPEVLGPPPEPQTGSGYPTCLPGFRRVAVILRKLTMGMDAETGEVLWQRNFRSPPRSIGRPRTPSIELIRWALRGLPVPPITDWLKSGLPPTTAWNPLFAGRLDRSGAASVLDPFDGREVSRARLGDLLGMRGGRLVAVGSRLCVVSGEPPVLSVLDGRSGRLLARWELPAAPGRRPMATAGGGRLLIADPADLYLFDLDEMRVAARSRIGPGVDAILHADAEWVLLRSLDGRGYAVPTGSGALVPLSADRARVLWATRAGEAAWLLEAEHAERTLVDGPRRHFLGSGFALRRVRLPDGVTTWRRTLGGAPSSLAGQPVAAGAYILLSIAEPGRVTLLGIDAQSGEEAFAIELEGPDEPEPVALQVAGGRVLLGVGGRVVALRTEGEPTAVP